MDELQSFVATHHIFHLIFDFDQTIARLVLPWDRYHDDIEATLRSYNPTIIESYIRGDLTLNDMENEYVREFGNKLLQLFRNHKKKFETERLQGINQNQELIEFIKSVEDLSLYIWTSNMPDAIVSFLRKEKMFDLFKRIVTRNDVTYVKPEPDGFDLLHDGNTAKEHYLLVGDSISDEQVAKRVGIPFFRVNPVL